MPAFISSLLVFLREHVVLAVAAAVAVVSMLAVPPDEAYLGYFDWKTLGCLFCVLAVVSALRLMGAFDRAARTVIARFRNPRSLSFALVLTTAALSMVATNDMALIIMLPLSAATLIGAGRARLVAPVFVLQNLAANLCGMIMPFGNPQNLYLYSYYKLHLGEFLNTMALPFALSTIGIIVCTWGLAGREGKRFSNTEGGVKHDVGSGIEGVSAHGYGVSPTRGNSRLGREPACLERSSSLQPVMPLSRRRLAIYGILLALTLLAVFRIVPVALAVAVVAAVLAVLDRRALAAVDWALLVTFACFFMFAGNIARVPEVSAWLSPLMADHGLAISVGVSQVISNVPTAVLLSHFTSAWQPLLVGVNIGGAGTLVGSLASLITLQHFTGVRKMFPHTRTMPELSTGRFVALFSILNVVFLIVLLVVCELTLPS